MEIHWPFCYPDAVLRVKTPRNYSLQPFIRAQAGCVFPLQQVQQQQWNQLVELWCPYYLPSCSTWSESLIAHTQNTQASCKVSWKMITYYRLIGAPGKALSILMGLIFVIPLILDARLMYRTTHLHYVFFGVRSLGSETWLTISTKFLVQVRFLAKTDQSYAFSVHSTENVPFDWKLCLGRAHR